MCLFFLRLERCRGMTEKSVTSAWSRGWSHRYLPGNVWEISELLHMRHV